MEELSLINEEYDDAYDEVCEQVSILFATKLKEECREILIKFHFEGYSMEQLMSIHDVNSVQAMKNKKMRCQNYFREILLKYDINPTLFKKWKPK